MEAAGGRAAAGRGVDAGRAAGRCTASCAACSGDRSRSAPSGRRSAWTGGECIARLSALSAAKMTACIWAASSPRQAFSNEALSASACCWGTSPRSSAAETRSMSRAAAVRDSASSVSAGGGSDAAAAWAFIASKCARSRSPPVDEMSPDWYADRRNSSTPIAGDSGGGRRDPIRPPSPGWPDSMR